MHNFWSRDKTLTVTKSNPAKSPEKVAQMLFLVSIIFLSDVFEERHISVTAVHFL